ncbi:hypothetical protein [Streptomyces lydicus]|uniref:hypothetical protein n=1 Tax=Streptomyces lydicus TaxID=47763 RepID=UPI000F8D4629|nr:hypothetical protein [Streptomyces lydicus]
MRQFRRNDARTAAGSWVVRRSPAALTDARAAGSDDTPPRPTDGRCNDFGREAFPDRPLAGYMIGLLAVGFAANELIRPVHPRHHEPPAPGARSAAGSATPKGAEQ